MISAILKTLSNESADDEMSGLSFRLGIEALRSMKREYGDTEADITNSGSVRLNWETSRMTEVPICEAVASTGGSTLETVTFMDVMVLDDTILGSKIDGDVEAVRGCLPMIVVVSKVCNSTEA